MKISKVVMVSMIVGIISFCGMANSVKAYSLTGAWWNKGKIEWRYENYISYRAKQMYVEGINEWKKKSIDAKISSGNKVVCGERNINDTWDGLTCPEYKTGSLEFKSQNVFLNKCKKQTWSSDGALKSVVIHEFGHVFGLADTSKTKNIMNGSTWGTKSRYGTYKLTTPQKDDISGVNKIY